MHGQEAVEWAAGEAGLSGRSRQWVREVLEQGHRSGIDGARHFGLGPRAVHVLQSGLHLALKADSYKTGVRNSILAGGDSTGRWVHLLTAQKVPPRIFSSKGNSTKGSTSELLKSEDPPKAM